MRTKTLTISFLIFIILSITLSGQNKKPNILFCLADDWGWPHAGVYGDDVVRTPTFDKIANEGVLFNYSFVSCPSCTPCRNSILAGQQFYRLGKGANLRGALDVNQPNFMFMLRDAGYDIGHWRKAWGPGNFKNGGYTEHPCGPQSTFTEFINNKSDDKPFCFWFGTSDPHRSYKLGSGVASGLDITKINVPDFFIDNETVQSDIADYYYEVERWNNDVEKALQILEDAGELDNTIVVMTGDHGMPFPRCKGNMYDWGVRVPLAIRWGNVVKPNQQYNKFVSLTDLTPTFLEAAGVDVSQDMTGESLLNILQGKKDTKAERDFVVFGRERHTIAQGKETLLGYPSRAIRTDEWLLIMNLEADRFPAGITNIYRDCDNSPTKTEIAEIPSSKYYNLCFAQRPAIELYDCKTDPDQVVNLANDPKYKKRVQKLKSQLVKYLEDTDDPRFNDEKVMFDTYKYNN